MKCVATADGVYDEDGIDDDAAASTTDYNYKDYEDAVAANDDADDASDFKWRYTCKYSNTITTVAMFVDYNNIITRRHFTSMQSDCTYGNVSV